MTNLHLGPVDDWYRAVNIMRAWDLQRSDLNAAIAKHVNPHVYESKLRARFSDVADRLGISIRDPGNASVSLLHNGANDSAFELQAMLAGFLLTDAQGDVVLSGGQLPPLPPTANLSAITANRQR